MKEAIDYIKQPKTIRKIIVVIFLMGGVWANLNIQIDKCEQDIDDIKALNLESTLSEIKTDIKWIRGALSD